MCRQEELPLGEIAEGGVASLRRRRPSLDERFDAFHASHPWVFEALEELAADWVEHGDGRISAKALFEQLRWSSQGVKGSGASLRLNNVFTSRYARLLCHEHPEWASAFELRRLRGARLSCADETLTVEVVVE